MRVPYEELLGQFERVLGRYLSPDRAHAAARIFADNSLVGVYSHGLNRFPVVVDYLRRGLIDPQVQPRRVAAFGAMERWDGRRGFGPLNAQAAMARAIELAGEFGIGLVALGNNNHWMRGGTYGWQAAQAGYVGICWSNTTPNMPAWGAVDPRLGNDPLVLAVPRANGEHVMVDCAMTQFSYGKLETTRLAGEELSVPGGYDARGELTRDPAAIEESGRPLPMGYWKGSGLSAVLEMVTALLAGGPTVAQIGAQGSETGLSQVLIAIDPAKLGGDGALVEDVVAHIHGSQPDRPGGQVRCPGEGEHRARRENLELGVPVDPGKWAQLLAM